MSEKNKSKAAGGNARAASLPKTARSAIAKKAAAARWGLKAIHKGNFLQHFGVDAECYVLGDENKTAVMTQRGIAAALGAKNPGGTISSG
ncbi:hypothetical protein LJJ44_08940 [Pseudomonas sp. B24_DOA]|nr:hypothetical protein LJJ44_08940 [Pseudomonas sp. B24_DOA]